MKGISLITGLCVALLGCGGTEGSGKAWDPDSASGTSGVTDSGVSDSGGSSGGSTGGDGGTSGTGTGGVACEGAWQTPWIGGPCDHDDDCAYDGGFCLMDEEGFPCGTCSMACDGLCPDLQDTPVTFCVDQVDLGLDPSKGTCISQCDPALLGGDGCRDGYDCIILERFDEPGTAKSVCVPDGLGDEPSSCQDELDARGILWEPAVHAVESPDGFPNLLCDIEDPVWLHSPVGDLTMVAKGTGTETPVKVSCEMALHIHDMAGILASFDAVSFEHWGTYNCRVVSGTDQLSMHGLGIAIDLTAFTLSDMTTYTVFDDWEDGVAAPVTPGGQWLKTLTDTLFEMMIYNIILTPNYNDAHDDHVHVDLTPGGDFYG